MTVRMPVVERVRRARMVVATVVIAVCVTTGAPPSAAQSAASGTERVATGDWVWPLQPPVVVERPFVAPAHAYGPGHRGIDLFADGDGRVRAPADGVVAFSGTVAGRGILTIAHTDGLVSTLEPVASDLAAGDAVTRGQPVAAVTAGGHALAGRLHFGVRRDGAYVNPLLLLGGVPRAVLLPCC